MTAQDQLTLRTVILHSESTESSAVPEYRLLNGLGHDVAATSSAGRAMELLQNDGTDLVVIDTDRAARRSFVENLTNLPADQQPKQVAIFSDAVDEGLETLVRNLQRGKVHVLLKPLHMHGLLQVLRSIEGKA